MPHENHFNVIKWDILSHIVHRTCSDDHGGYRQPRLKRQYLKGLSHTAVELSIYMRSAARNGGMLEIHVQSTHLGNQHKCCPYIAKSGRYTRMGTLGVLKVAMANPQGRANTNKGILSLGIRLSGSHLHSTRLTNSTSLIIRIGGVLLHPGSQPGTGRPTSQAHTTPLAIGVRHKSMLPPARSGYDSSSNLMHLCVHR